MEITMIVVSLIQILIIFGILAIMVQLKMIKNAFDDILVNYLSSLQNLITLQKGQLKSQSNNSETVLKQMRESQNTKNTIAMIENSAKTLSEMSNIIRKNVDENKKNQVDINKININMTNLNANMKALSNSIILLNKKRG